MAICSCGPKASGPSSSAEVRASIIACLGSEFGRRLSGLKSEIPLKQQRLRFKDYRFDLVVRQAGHTEKVRQSLL
jgi:hypothetical protein